jgi:hypothetical protein
MPELSKSESPGSEAPEAEAVARVALAEIAPAGTVGALVDSTAAEEGVLALNFVSTLPGYPGWHWSASVANLAGEEPTVLEVELMPGEGALLAPDWVPWVDRLEEYHVAQAALAAQAGDDELLDGEPLDDDDLDDDDDEHGDDDLGDDPDDGIDFESALLLDDEDEDDEDADVSTSGLPTSGVDEQDEAEAEADDDGPE